MDKHKDKVLRQVLGPHPSHKDYEEFRGILDSPPSHSTVFPPPRPWRPSPPSALLPPSSAHPSGSSLSTSTPPIASTTNENMRPPSTSAPHLFSPPRYGPSLYRPGSAHENPGIDSTRSKGLSSPMAGFKNPSPQRTPPLAPAIPTRGSSSSPTTLRQQQAHPRSSPVQSTFLSSPYLSQASRPRVNQLVSFDDLANAVENLGTTISVAQLRDTWVTQEEWSAASKQQQQQQQQRQQHQEQKQHHGRRHHTLSSPTDDALLPSSRGVSGGARNDSILTAVAALGSAIRTAASAVVIVVYRDGSTTVRPTTLSQRKRYRGWVRAALGNVLAAGGRAASTSTSTSSSASGGGVVSTLTSSPLSAALKRPTPITSPERTRSSSSSSSSSSSVSPSTLRHPAHAARSFLSGALSVAAQDLIHVHSDVAAQAGTELTEHDITTFACEMSSSDVLALVVCLCSNSSPQNYTGISSSSSSSSSTSTHTSQNRSTVREGESTHEADEGDVDVDEGVSESDGWSRFVLSYRQAPPEGFHSPLPSPPPPSPPPPPYSQLHAHAHARHRGASSSSSSTSSSFDALHHQVSLATVVDDLLAQLLQQGRDTVVPCLKAALHAQMMIAGNIPSGPAVTDSTAATSLGRTLRDPLLATWMINPDGTPSPTCPITAPEYQVFARACETRLHLSEKRQQSSAHCARSSRATSAGSQLELNEAGQVLRDVGLLHRLADDLWGLHQTGDVDDGGEDSGDSDMHAGSGRTSRRKGASEAEENRREGEKEEEEDEDEEEEEGEEEEERKVSSHERGKRRRVGAGADESVNTGKTKRRRNSTLKNTGTLDAYALQELPMTYLLAEMEMRGAPFDHSVLASHRRNVAGHIATLEAQAHKMARRNFLLTSPEQVAHVLYDVLHLPQLHSSSRGMASCKGRKSSSGGAGHHSTSEDRLARLKDLHPLPGVILQHRTWMRTLTTYIDPLLKACDVTVSTACPSSSSSRTSTSTSAAAHVSSSTSTLDTSSVTVMRLHPTWNQTCTSTGRISCSRPNLQAMPKRKEVNLAAYSSTDTTVATSSTSTSSTSTSTSSTSSGSLSPSSKTQHPPHKVGEKRKELELTPQPTRKRAGTSSDGKKKSKVKEKEKGAGASVGVATCMDMLEPIEENDDDEDTHDGDDEDYAENDKQEDDDGDGEDAHDTMRRKRGATTEESSPPQAQGHMTKRHRAAASSHALSPPTKAPTHASLAGTKRSRSPKTAATSTSKGGGGGGGGDVDSDGKKREEEGEEEHKGEAGDDDAGGGGAEGAGAGAGAGGGGGSGEEGEEGTEALSVVRDAIACPTPVSPGVATVLISADYVQFEMRLLGHLCGDPGLLNIFKSPSTSSSTSSAAPAVAVDIYKEMAINLFDAKPGTVTKQQREQAKTISLGLIYGMGPLYLSIQLTKITGVKHNMQQAKTLMDKFFGQYPGVHQYNHRVLQEARQQGYVTTLRGRRRLLPNLESSEANLRAYAERQCLNSIIQGSCSDLLKQAMLKLHSAFRSSPRYSGVHMVLQLHDEIVIETPTAVVEEVARTVRRVMENAVPEAKVAFPVALNVGPTWGHMTPLSLPKEGR